MALLFGRSHLQAVSLLSSICCGVVACLIVQAREVQHKQVFGIYFTEEDTWVPLAFGVTVAIMAGGCIPLARHVPLLYAQAIVLFQVAILRMMNIAPVSLNSEGHAFISIYTIVSMVVFMGALVLAYRIVPSHPDEVLAFATLKMGILFVVGGVLHFVQRAGLPSNRPYSPLDDYGLIFEQIREGQCVIWDVDTGKDATLKEGEEIITGCTFGGICQAAYIAWIVGAYTSFMLWLVITKVSEKSQYRPVETETTEDLSEDPFAIGARPDPQVFGAAYQGPPARRGHTVHPEDGSPLDNFQKLRSDLDKMLKEKSSAVEQLQAELQDVMGKKAAAVKAEQFAEAKALKKRADEIDGMIANMRTSG